MEKIRPAYGIPDKRVNAITMLDVVQAHLLWSDAQMMDLAM